MQKGEREKPHYRYIRHKDYLNFNLRVFFSYNGKHVPDEKHSYFQPNPKECAVVMDQIPQKLIEIPQVPARLFSVIQKRQRLSVNYTAR